MTLPSRVWKGGDDTAAGTRGYCPGRGAKEASAAACAGTTISKERISTAAHAARAGGAQRRPSTAPPLLASEYSSRPQPPPPAAATGEDLGARRAYTPKGAQFRAEARPAPPAPRIRSGANRPRHNPGLIDFGQVRRRAQRFLTGEERRLRKQLWRELAPGYIPGVPPLPRVGDSVPSSRAPSAASFRARQQQPQLAGRPSSCAPRPPSSLASDGPDSRGTAIAAAAALAAASRGDGGGGPQPSAQQKSRQSSLLVRTSSRPSALARARLAGIAPELQ